MNSVADFIKLYVSVQTLWYIAAFLGILCLTWLFARLFERIFNRFILRSTLLMNNNPTSYQFVKHLAKAVIYLVGLSMAIYVVPSLRTLSASLLAGAGILAVAFGFASQAAFSNIISGLFIVVFRPFRVNDRVTINATTFGVVEDITLRHTVIRNPENKRIVIPNSIISSQQLINADLIDEKVCKFIEIGISYDSDIDLAMDIMRTEVTQHPLWIDNRNEEQMEKGDPAVAVRVMGLGDFAVTLRAWAWAKDNADAFEMGCDLLKSIKKSFEKQGIEIPFPYRTIVYKNAPKEN